MKPLRQQLCDLKARFGEIAHVGFLAVIAS